MESKTRVTFHVYRGQKPLLFSTFSVEFCLRKWFSSTLSVMGITPAEVSHRALAGSQQIQSLVKDRRFLLHYSGNPGRIPFEIRPLPAAVPVQTVRPRALPGCRPHRRAGAAGGRHPRPGCRGAGGGACWGRGRPGRGGAKRPFEFPICLRDKEKYNIWQRNNL